MLTSHLIQSFHKQDVCLSVLGYAVTHNDSFSSPHSDFCAFFCPCLEKLSKLENDRTISPAVNQTETHFPAAAASSAISQRWNHCTKLFCQNNCCSYHTPYKCYISHAYLRSGLLSGSLALATIASLFLACLWIPGSCMYMSADAERFLYRRVSG